MKAVNDRHVPQSHKNPRHNRNIRSQSLSAVDFWNWSELEFEHSRAAEFHSKLVEWNGFSRRSRGYDQADCVKKKLPNNFVKQTPECS